MKVAAIGVGLILLTCRVRGRRRYPLRKHQLMQNPLETGRRTDSFAPLLWNSIPMQKSLEAARPTDSLATLLLNICPRNACGSRTRRVTLSMLDTDETQLPARLPTDSQVSAPIDPTREELLPVNPASDLPTDTQVSEPIISALPDISLNPVSTGANGEAELPSLGSIVVDRINSFLSRFGVYFDPSEAFTRVGKVAVALFVVKIIIDIVADAIQKKQLEEKGLQDDLDANGDLGFVTDEECDRVFRENGLEVKPEYIELRKYQKQLFQPEKAEKAKIVEQSINEAALPPWTGPAVFLALFFAIFFLLGDILAPFFQPSLTSPVSVFD